MINLHKSELIFVPVPDKQILIIKKYLILMLIACNSKQ